MGQPDTVVRLAFALHELADALQIEGQGADTLPARATAERVRYLADRAAKIAGPAWTRKRAHE